MLKRLLDIRLTHLFGIFVVLFFIILTIINPHKLTSGQLALYSVNTFLFGYYFGPILSSQKGRVADISKTIRQEEMAILDILAQSHLLKEDARLSLKSKLKVYIDSVVGNRNARADNPYYDELLRFTKQPKYKDDQVMGTIYTRLAKTQENRDNLQNYFQTTLFSHEWLVLGVLFLVTIFFIMQTDYNGVVYFRMLLAVLLSGLSLLIIILAKYATLTHKQAKRMWVPLYDVITAHFEDVDPADTASEKHKTDTLAA